MIDEIFLALGPIGMILLVIAYISMLTGKLPPNTYKFLFSNWFGGFFLMLNGFYYLTGIMLVYPILNVIWTIGTTIQIYREHRKRGALMRMLDREVKKAREKGLI